MNNLLPSAVKLHQKYDLKGSTYKRKVCIITYKDFYNYFTIILFNFVKSFYFDRHPNRKDQKNHLHIKIWILWNTIQRVFF